VSETSKPSGVTSRRAIVGGICGIGVAVGLTACGSSGGNGGPSSPNPGNVTSPNPPVDTGPIKTSDIPVGGGKIYAGDDTVVTQPTQGDFKAFSATCTHEGCLLTAVRNGTINCPCHGSRYSIEDGSVKHAATGLTIATQDPLPAKAVTVKGDIIEVT